MTYRTRNTKKPSYTQQLIDIAKRAHAWAFVLPVSAIANVNPLHQHVTYHRSTRG